MQALSYRLEDIVPHRAPMLLIDAVESFDPSEGSLVASFAARRGWSENWAAVEYMAQTAAALAGAMDVFRGHSGPPRPGFLLGTRRLELFTGRFTPGRIYTAKAVCVAEDSQAASFSCEILDSGAVVARATLTAFRPLPAGR